MCESNGALYSFSSTCRDFLKSSTALLLGIQRMSRGYGVICSKSHTVSEGRNWSFHPGAALSAPLWGVNIIYTVYSAVFLSLGAASTAHLTLSRIVSQVFLETFHSVSAQWSSIVPPGSHLFPQRVASPVGVLSSYNGALWSPWVQFGCTLPIFTAR